LKRVIDLALCLLVLPLVLPVFTCIALAIWCDDQGPPLFTQMRCGLRRRAFLIYKFRTMRNQQVTRVGRILRMSGLDETAQWLNVVLGDMSIVGPRPLTSADITRLGWDRQQLDKRFSVKPGITGLAQLYGGVGERWTRGIDRLYRARASMALDARIMLWSFVINVCGKRRVRGWLLGLRRC
jgi:lipopolysaccharide/colanic/teichoic acid biosynthesis glycosyltransferase